jgi:endonuclease/exonuclease/phosphatase family metal-dependent hydrolase
MSDLTRTVDQLKAAGYKIVVTGDFNATVDELKNYSASEVKLNLSKSPANGTRHGRNGSTATLDYFMTSPVLEASDTECVAQMSSSDHELLKIEVKIDG